MSRYKLKGQAGFSLVGTLIGVTVGAVIAVLVVTVISDSIRGKRAAAERDEASEFTLYVKNLLTSDSTCSQVLGGKAFSESTVAPLELNGIGYADQTSADVKKGFSFAGDTLSVEELSMENTTREPVAIEVTMEWPQGSGNFANRTLRRHLMRVKLALTENPPQTFLRPRYFVIPVLVSGNGTIEVCNNEVNPADACQSMGFRWDTGTNPPACVPDSACLFGGHYRVKSTGVCAAPHPITGTCACPMGYKRVEVGATNIGADSHRPCSKGCDKLILRYDVTVQCYKCPL